MMAATGALCVSANENRGPMLVALVWTLAAVAIVTVILRVYSRLYPDKLLGKDDVAIMVALVSPGFLR